MILEVRLSMIRNLNLSLKLWLIVLPAVLALAGLLILFIIRSNDIEKQSKTALYDEVYVSSSLTLNADRDFYQAAIAEKELYLSPQLSADDKKSLIKDFDDNKQQVQDRIKGAVDNIRANSALYSQFRHPDAKMTMEQLYTEFQKYFNDWLTSYDNNTGKGNIKDHQTAFDKARGDINLMGELLDAYAKSESAEIHKGVQNSITTTVIVVSIVILFIVILSVLIVTYLRGSIKYITNVSRRIAAGELALKIDARRKSRDEIGKLSTATEQILIQLNAYVGYIDEITATLTAMAEGDMNIELKYDYAGQFKSIKDAFSDISETLGGTLITIRTASEQVKGGAAMIAAGAQTLAQGSTEQASAVEQLSSTVDSVAEETGKNAGSIKSAVESMQATLKKIEESNAYMERMLESMKSIGETSNRIRTVIKLIDDIAFQTNILALNAAVEAARAGQYGKGFAVVAAEVKNLATKSADAANQTSELIGSSIKSVEEGVKIARNTADALSDVSDKVIRVNTVFSGISASSLNQAKAMKEIKTGISQISSVILTNSATAEESASASQELSGQAELLYSEAAHFRMEGEKPAANGMIMLAKH